MSGAWPLQNPIHLLYSSSVTWLHQVVEKIRYGAYTRVLDSYCAKISDSFHNIMYDIFSLYLCLPACKRTSYSDKRRPGLITCSIELL